MKTVVAVAAIGSLIASFAAHAQGWLVWWHAERPPVPPPHQHIGGDQMALPGLVTAAVVSVVGYLAIRRGTNA